MAFKPERFLGDQPEPDPHRLSFGFGRRVCPGRILADNSLFLNIAQSMAVFRIDKPVHHGRDVEPVISFQPGVVSYPVPYQTRISPRSSKHEELIRAVERAHPWEESDAKELASISV